MDKDVLRYDSSVLFEGNLFYSRLHDLFPRKCPHRIGNVWELPISCLDDYNLFERLKRTDEFVTAYWKKKVDVNIDHHNYFLLLVHPPVIANHFQVLKGLSKDLGIGDSVVFAGLRPPEEIPKIINLSEVCLFPLPDSSALAIFEYMACARPVVLPTGGTNKMSISKEMLPEDCLLQVESSPEEFAAGINSLLNNKIMASEIGQKARDLVVRLYDWDDLARRYQKALEEVLNG
ncbi:glycosyltransferase family 4 protein [bacterium]|nr:glycosyltransferase family 4 protein [bacterium]